LLRVFLAEVGAIGLDDPEQLHHHRRHASEMTGLKAPHRCSVTPATSTKLFSGRRYISAARWREDDVRIARSAEFEV